MEPGRGWRVLLIVLLAAGCAWFAYRGPVRAIRGGSYDFTLIYGSARAWLSEGRPYEKQAVQRAWESGGGPGERDPMHARGEATLVYPPVTFPLLMPFAALPWRAASTAWAACGTAMYLTSVWLIGAMTFRSPAVQRGHAAAPDRRARNAELAFWAGAVWLGPGMTSIGLGQTAAAVLFLVAAGYAAARGEPGAGRGTLLGAAAALKPQLGALFAAYEAGRLRLRAVAAAAVLVAVLAAIGIGRMEQKGVAWWGQWRDNLAAFTTLDDANPTRGNPIRFQLINLAYPLHTLTDSRAAVLAIVYGLVGGLCLAYFVIDLRRGRARGEEEGELLSLSMVGAVTLMVAYHRYYDAVLLLFPLALAVRGVMRPARRPGRPARWMYGAVLGLVLVYLVPGSVVLVRAAERGLIPAGLSRSPAWEAIILPHAAWALPALAVMLVWMRARTGPEQA
jgi:hypothetical protein